MYLYKFSDLNVNKLACLASNTIWFSGIDTLNDPFEGKYHDSELENNTPEKRMLDYSLKYSVPQGILCMSAHCEKRLPHLNNLMWSHYANGLRGYCLKFNKQRFLESIYGLNGGVLLLATKYFSAEIIYSEETIPKPPRLHEKISNNAQELENIFLPMFSTKSSHWSYENEYRLLSQSVGKHSYDPASLDELIIGERMPFDQQKLLVSIVKTENPKIKIKMATLKKNSYQIETIELQSDHFEKMVPQEKKSAIDNKTQMAFQLQHSMRNPIEE
jgi:hypothetical protein